MFAQAQKKGKRANEIGFIFFFFFFFSLSLCHTMNSIEAIDRH
jgi:hypothetical protein